jgi:hypothetical protein
MANENGNTKILDLDKFIPDDREVVINKIKYRVNGSASVRTTLALMKSAETWTKSPASPESINKLILSIQAFFIDPIETETLEALDVSGQLPKLVAFLYGKEINETKEGQDEKNGESRADK